MTLDLSNNSYKPFIKTNQHPSYININSNHPKNINKQAPKAVNLRIWKLSANEKKFKESSKMYISKVSKVGDHSREGPEGSLFDSLLHQGVGEGATPFPGLLHFTLDPYLIRLSVKQGGIKYHFLSLWYDSTWDWTQVSRAIGEHSNR